MPHEIDILYFAWVKERLGRDQETIAYPETAQTVGQLVTYLLESDPSYKDVFADLKKLRFALDQDFVGLDQPLANAKELAIFPPVTGG